MATVFKPHYTETQILAPWAVARGDVKRVTVDLRTCISGQLLVAIGTSGTTSMTNGPVVRCVPTLNNDGASRFYSAQAKPEMVIPIAMGQRLINYGAGYAAGTTSIAFDGSGGTSFVVGDALFFWGVTSVPGSTGAISPANGCELLRVSKGTSTQVVVCTPCKYAKIDNEIFSQGYGVVYDLEGGYTWEATVDYGDDAAGDIIAAMMDLVSLDYMEQATV